MTKHKIILVMLFALYEITLIIHLTAYLLCKIQSIHTHFISYYSELIHTYIQLFMLLTQSIMFSGLSMAYLKFILLTLFIPVVDPSVCTDSFPYMCRYCSKGFFSIIFQSLKSINISSKHSSCIPLQIPLSVLDTKVKLGMVQFKAFFFHTKSLVPLGIPCKPKMFLCVFHSPVSLPFARQTLHHLVFDFMPFHSSGVFFFDRPTIPSC